MKLRQWQQDCLDSFVRRRAEKQTTFVFEACPGAGKSLMAAELSWQMVNEDDPDNRIDLVIVIVPWKSIQGDQTAGMIKTFDRRGLRVRDRLMLGGSRIVQQPVPSNLDAIVTTYQEAMSAEGIDTAMSDDTPRSALLEDHDRPLRWPVDRLPDFAHEVHA